eukprot:CAMPEP_0175889340 /NCGR_PEP_ID=MMETSP0107_2-20121207/47208_1 /TAXON_ID=195067 ORGANISM="Goniomonas pacifica, Strain CCMP1869" /NCGR_SAMPLE_ID=MMETSP0107_2 /ASSEMBLY_ACC=CAM_ASM_000203 /LENGTH=236 /DNA_ID=CAMNT_0017209963 /DNA_START=162 /DNA_END=869 /DNA_ORIENTATION=-
MSSALRNASATECTRRQLSSSSAWSHSKRWKGKLDPAHTPAPAPTSYTPAPTSYTAPKPTPGASFAPRGPVAQADMSNVQPINTLNPYQQNRWTIRARIIKKNIRPYKNDRGEGKVMSIDMMDESGEIRGTSFNQTADKINDVVEAGKCYVISSRGQLKIANKRFNSLKNEYEINFSDDVTFTPIADDDTAAPKMRYNFVEIGSLEQVPKDHVIDVIGVVEHAFPVGSITVKNGPN